MSTLIQHLCLDPKLGGGSLKKQDPTNTVLSHLVGLFIYWGCAKPIRCYFLQEEPDYVSVQKCKYLEMVIQETLRMHPIAQA